MNNYKDFPLEEVVKQAGEKLRAIPGSYVHQKWTCQHCRSRQTMVARNSFHRAGTCEECGGTTILTRCNYLFVMPGRGS
jgi:hypothetical protein